MLGLLGALNSETAFIRRRMTIDAVKTAASCHIVQGTYRGTPIVLATTGMGKQRAEAAARFVLDTYPLSLVLSLGFAGALTDELSLGDVVLGVRWHATQGEDDRFQPIVPDAHIRGLAEQALARAGVEFTSAEGVTVPDLLCDPAEKTALAERTGAHIADMESTWIAAVAAARGVPFLSIRAISDVKSERLLPFTQLMTCDGQWKARQTACYFIQRPHHVAVLLRMARSIPRAKRHLATALDAVIDGLGQGGDV